MKKAFINWTKVFAILCILSFVSAFAATIVGAKDSVTFRKECKTYIWSAVHTVDPNVAVNEFDVALSYLEEKGLTKGDTSLFYYSTEDDIGIFYQRILSAREAVTEVRDSGASELEVSNVMLNIQSALCDENGDVICPSYIGELRAKYKIIRYSVLLGWLFFLIFAFLDYISYEMGW